MLKFHGPTFAVKPTPGDWVDWKGKFLVADENSCSDMWLLAIGYALVGYLVAVVLLWNVIRLMVIAVRNRYYSKKYKNLMLDYKMVRSSNQV